MLKLVNTNQTHYWSESLFVLDFVTEFWLYRLEFFTWHQKLLYLQTNNQNQAAAIIADPMKQQITWWLLTYFGLVCAYLFDTESKIKLP